MDVSFYVNMLGTKTDISHLHQLKILPNIDALTNKEILEIVLEEDWKKVSRKYHIERQKNDVLIIVHFRFQHFLLSLANT